MTGSDGRQSARLWRHDGLLSALAVAERVRWQLDGWRGGGTSGDAAEGAGITMLRLVPDQLVPDPGRQLSLWGETQAGDRVARAAVRVQAMLGHEAVTRPVISGGRCPAEQMTLAPFGDARPPRLPPDRPWPGSIPAPAPATVYPDPLPARVTDASGTAVTVTGRARVSSAPAWLAAGAAAPRPRHRLGRALAGRPSGGGSRPRRAARPGSRSSPRMTAPGWWRCRMAAGSSKPVTTEGGDDGVGKSAGPMAGAGAAPVLAQPAAPSHPPAHQPGRPGPG